MNLTRGVPLNTRLNVMGGPIKGEIALTGYWQLATALPRQFLPQHRSVAGEAKAGFQIHEP
jgi:hypothetical protein